MVIAWYDESAANDRLLFAAVLATIVHFGVILGIGFSPEEHDSPAQNLEITLATRPDTENNENADFLAQANQRGSGTESERNEVSSPIHSPIPDAEMRQPVPHIEARELTPPKPREYLDTRERQHPSVASAVPERESAEATSVPLDTQIESTEQPRDEIASLVARLANQQQAYAKLPRVRRLTTVSARADEDADYLYAWKQRIESIGNQNYPAEARRRKLYGELRLLVVLRPDGTVVETRVLQSSGHRILDDAARHIVHLAAPFQAFPASLHARVDELQIIRTWQFRADRLTAGE